MNKGNMIWFGLILTIIGAIFTTIGVWNSRIITQNKLDGLNESNLELANKLAHATGELSNQNTGGEDYTVLKLLHDRKDGKCGVGAFNMNNNYHIFDLRVRIEKVDIDDRLIYQYIKSNKIPDGVETTTVGSFDYGGLPRGNIFEIGRIDLPSDGYGVYRVRCYARNGLHLQTLILKKDSNNEWKTATFVYSREDDSDLIYTDKEPDFPINSNNNLDLWKTK